MNHFESLFLFSTFLSSFFLFFRVIQWIVISVNLGWISVWLSLAKRIVEEVHGGHISVVASEPGKGACFRLVFAPQ